MLSMAKAKALKEAGLSWEPQPKDDFAYESGKISWLYEFYPAVCRYPERFVWLPSLSQLLAEVEKHGYTWELGISTTHGGPMDPGVHKSGYWCEAFRDNKLAHRVATREETPEDAAAEVLIKILKEVSTMQEG